MAENGASVDPNRTSFPLELLAPEILILLLGYLPLKGVLVCMRVSRTWNETIKNVLEVLPHWRRACAREGTEKGLTVVRERYGTYYKAYRHHKLLSASMLIVEEVTNFGQWNPLHSSTYCSQYTPFFCDGQYIAGTVQYHSSLNVGITVDSIDRYSSSGGGSLLTNGTVSRLDSVELHRVMELSYPPQKYGSVIAGAVITGILLVVFSCGKVLGFKLQSNENFFVHTSRWLQRACNTRKKLNMSVCHDCHYMAIAAQMSNTLVQLELVKVSNTKVFFALHSDNICEVSVPSIVEPLQVKMLSASKTPSADLDYSFAPSYTCSSHQVLVKAKNFTQSIHISGDPLSYMKAPIRQANYVHVAGVTSITTYLGEVTIDSSTGILAIGISIECGALKTQLFDKSELLCKIGDDQEPSTLGNSKYPLVLCYDAKKLSVVLISIELPSSPS